MDAAAPLSGLSATTSPVPAPRRLTLRGAGFAGILALVVMATVLVAVAMGFRGAVQDQLQALEQAHARYDALQQLRHEAVRGGATPARLESLDQQLRDTERQREEHLAKTRHYIDGTTVTIATLAWLGITSVAGVALLFFTRLAADIVAVRRRAIAILRGDRSRTQALTRRDELGDLSQAVEDLAETLGLRERELEVDRRHVLHQEKLATIGTMAAGVIRDIGNPIAAIDGYARALLETRDVPAPAPSSEAGDVRPILHETARLIAITREISALAAAPASQWQLASINDIVQQTLALLRYEPRFAGVKLSATLDPQLPAITACAERLVQLLTNLLTNAADATAALPPHTARIDIATCSADGGIELVVEDNGCGLTDEVARRAFEPLFTTKPAETGTGLGLTVCRSIAEDHGGRISLERRAGGGARARLWLPLEKGEPLH